MEHVTCKLIQHGTMLIVVVLAIPSIVVIVVVVVRVVVLASVFDVVVAIDLALFSATSILHQIMQDRCCRNACSIHAAFNHATRRPRA